MENQAMVALKDDQNKGSDLNGKLPIHALSNQITTQDGATIEFDKKLTKEQYIAILNKINNDINILLKDENFLAKLTNENLKITSISNYTFKNATIISNELDGVTFENCIIEENASIHFDNEKIIFNNCKFGDQTSIHSSNAEAEIIISNSTLPEKIPANTKGDERIKSRQNALKFVGKFKNLTLDSNQDGGLINTSLAEIKKDNMNNPIIFIQNGSPLDSTQVLKLYGGSLIKKGNLRKEIITAQIQAKINDAKNNNEDIDNEEALSRCIISENERKINIVGGINFLTKCQTNLGKETNNSKKALEEINEAIISIVKLASNNNYHVTSLDPNSLGLIDTYTRIFSLSNDEKIAIEKFLNEKLNELQDAPQEHKKNETDNPPRDNNDSQPVQASTTQTIFKEFKDAVVKLKIVSQNNDNESLQEKFQSSDEFSLSETFPNANNDDLYPKFGILSIKISIPLKFSNGTLIFKTNDIESYTKIINHYKNIDNVESMTYEDFLKTNELKEFIKEKKIKVKTMKKIQDNISQQTKESKTTEENEPYERQGEQFHDEFNFTTVNEEKTEANDNDNNKTNNTSQREKNAKKKKNKNPRIDESNDYNRSERKNKERDKKLTQQIREARKAKRTH